MFFFRNKNNQAAAESKDDVRPTAKTASAAARHDARRGRGQVDAATVEHSSIGVESAKRSVLAAAGAQVLEAGAIEASTAKIVDVKKETVGEENVGYALKSVAVPVVRPVEEETVTLERDVVTEVVKGVEKPQSQVYVRDIPRVHVQPVDRPHEVEKRVFVDKVMDVDQVKEVEKFVPNVQQQEITREVRVPQIEYVDRHVEVEQIEWVDVPEDVLEYREVVKHVPKIIEEEVEKYVEKRVPKVIVKKNEVVKEIEKIVYYDEPYDVVKEVEKIVEIVQDRQVPKIKVVDVDVPYFVYKEKWVDRQVDVIKEVAVPVHVDVIKEVPREVEVVQYVDKYVDTPVELEKVCHTAVPYPIQA